jgi:23S rRNA (guanosine2251-2'-O)-methyltransferase
VNRRAGGSRQSGHDRVTPHEATVGPDLVYGRNPVREALRGRRRVHAILLATGTSGAIGGGGEDLEKALPEWCRTPSSPNAASGAPGRVPPVRRITAAELTARLQTPDHQGIAAEVDPYPYLEPEQLLGDCTLLVALDEVQDPHNLGAIIRTAEGAGAGVVIPRHRAVEVTAAVVKASAGATEHAAVARVRNLADFLIAAKKDGFWIYGTDAGAESSYTAQDYIYPTCFVLGSEGQGLGHRVASLCDVIVGLPLTGRVESLNVSVSAGVLLYEALRQRAAGRTAEEGDA